jgi:uridylate kinase
MDMLAELHKRVMRNVPADANDGRELAAVSGGGYVYRKATQNEVREP